MTAIVIVVVSVVGWFASSPGSGSKAPTPATALPSIEELGVKPDPHEEVDSAPPAGSTWSSFWSGSGSASTPSPPAQSLTTISPSSQAGGKRVGDE